MKITLTANTKIERVMRLIALLILAIGVVLRIVVYLQNRNLFIDEANVARNIYERTYGQLLTPLNYEQYAAPLFVWILKLATQIFGYSEYAYRLFPLMAGIGALYSGMLLFREFVSFKALWYPLFFLATFFVFVRFSGELKQYGSDMLLTNVLVLLSLRTDILKVSTFRFIVLFGIAGSLAIWLSMPVVFILFSIGVYYFAVCLSSKQFNKLLPLFSVAAIWLVQFLVYYITVLKKQANSDYLQNYHAGFFINLLPHTKDECLHNWYLMRDQLITIGGGTFLAWTFNLAMMLLGAYALIKQNKEKAILILLPLLATYFASAFHQYAFVERLMLFVMPLLMVLLAYGLGQLMNLNLWPVFIAVVLLCILNCANHQNLDLFYNRMQFEEMTSELEFLKQNRINGNELFVNHGARPAFIYYTQIHPNKDRWNTFENAHLLWWDVNYDTLVANMHGRNAFIYTSISDNDLIRFKEKLGKQMKLDTALDISWCRKYAFIYNKP
jgi:4-amino-4-deoxy-L-arabinose transferase-like glycosyltransferase